MRVEDIESITPVAVFETPVTNTTTLFVLFVIAEPVHL